MNVICLLRDLNNEHAVSSPVFPSNVYFMAIFQIPPSQLQELDFTLLVSFRHIIIYWHRVLIFFNFIVIFPSYTDQFKYIILLIAFQIKFLLFCHCTHIVTYVTEHLWLPHWKYESCNHYTKWAYRPNIFAYLY